MPNTLTYPNGMPVPLRMTPSLYSDNAGSATFLNTNLWQQCWEDDLILTGVRSFDVKAYDNSYPGYVDLGWGDDLRAYYTPATVPPSPPLIGALGATPGSTNPSFTAPSGLIYSLTGLNSLYGQTYAHEGRIPPLVWDQRTDSQDPRWNLGDDNTSVVRLRRVWDSWSTDYSNAPAVGVDPASGMPYPNVALAPALQRPVLPSYPPPYPMPLRGIQIQVRVVDPRNERIKVLTVRQDLSDRL
jgi:hypothetical protein